MSDAEPVAAAVADGLTVVVVRVDGATSREIWRPLAPGGLLPALQATVGGLVDVVRLAPMLDMWVNDEGLYSQPVNPLATAIGRVLGAVQPFHGPAVFTGSADHDGRTLGLSESWVRMLMKVAAEFDALGDVSAELGVTDLRRPGTEGV